MLGIESSQIDRSYSWKPQKSVLVVEDDMIQRTRLVGMLKDFSTKGAFTISDIHEAATGEDAVAIAEENMIDLAILDIVLIGSEFDGYEVCRQLKHEGDYLGRIIMLSGERYTGEDKADGLDVGADDYMSKPYSDREFWSRIEKQFRDGENSGDPRLRFGQFVFYPGRKRIVLGDGTSEMLTDKESSILHMLYSARGQVVRRSTLLQEVWGYNPRVNTHTLETHVYRVRQKIEPVPNKPKYVIACDGGYRLEYSPKTGTN